MEINSHYDEFIKNLIRYWNKAESVDIIQVDNLMDGLSSAYLDSTSEQREAIRKLFRLGDTHLYLQEYARRVAAKIVAMKDSHLLLLGLAAISIEDNRSDYRDTLICLGDLCLSTEKAGIYPKPYLDQVAEISNTEIRDGGTSTSDLMRDFPNTPYYRELKGKPLTEEEKEHYREQLTKRYENKGEVRRWWKVW